MAACRTAEGAVGSEGASSGTKAPGVPGVFGSSSGTWRFVKGKAGARGECGRLRAEGGLITVLTGGTGGAKFVDGLRRVVPTENLTIIVNTGDDHRWWGLYVSPDIDSITYVLAGKLSNERGWGVRGDTFHCLQTMKELGEPSWFSVGDRDVALHLLRTRLLSEGQTLSQATTTIAERFGLRSRILPMSDQPVETRIET